MGTSYFLVEVIIMDWQVEGDGAQDAIFLSAMADGVLLHHSRDNSGGPKNLFAILGSHLFKIRLAILDCLCGTLFEVVLG